MRYFRWFTFWLNALLSQTALSQTITDADSNTYATVVIGNQTWMSTNLRTTHFQNGDPIPTTDPCYLDIHLETEATYQWAYNCNDSLAHIYGRLYTWYVIADSRQVCPAGWHVPSLDEFKILSDFLGGDAVAGGKLKETGIGHWQSPNLGATNEVGFNGVANGHRSLDGSFTGLQYVSDMWTSTEGSLGARDFDLNHDQTTTISYDDNKEFGFAIRCLKNEDTTYYQDLSKLVPYPVPAQNRLFVKSDSTSNFNWQITSTEGQLLQEGVVEGTFAEIDLELLAPGLYFIIFSNQKNERAVYKFIHY